MSDTADYEALPQRTSLRGRRRDKDEPRETETVHQQQQSAAVPAGPSAAADTADSHQITQQLEGLSHHEHRQQQPNMPAYRSAAVGQHKFEYLDHTADVQLHAWGGSLKEAFEQVGLAMFNYMTPVDALCVDDACTRDFSASGHDLHSLLFAYLDELLFVYSTEYIMMKHIHITTMDTEEHTITATCHGEKFDRHRHECGTEVKAITYSAMQIRERQGDAEVFVIVDI
eukprot:GHUV01008805.1.p1 GENE.GHUV01008805.1~~GHUV01008805.1.p1  ORF type:complete len:228 (+),score=74.02 GHUV01008805.1:1157-1840(+)